MTKSLFDPLLGRVRTGDDTIREIVRTEVRAGAGGSPGNLSQFTTDDLAEGTTNLYSQWEVFSATSTYLTPKNDAYKVYTGNSDALSEMEEGGLVGSAFQNDQAISFFSIVANGDIGGFTPWGGLIISARSDGSGGAEADVDAGDWLGGHAFIGYYDSAYKFSSNANNLAPGLWADVSSAPSGTYIPTELWLGGVSTQTISLVMDSTQDIVSINKPLNDVDFRVYWDSGTSIFSQGSDGYVSIGSASAANGLLTVGTNTTANTGGIWFGTDTNLYRNASNRLRTEDSFSIGRSFRTGAVTTQTASSLNVTDAHCIILCDCTSNNITLNLPTAASISGRVYYIKKTDATANTVTVDGNGSQTIDGATTATISTQYESITIVSDGSNWHIV